MDTDEIIINCIKQRSKTISEISAETNISINRVGRRVNSFRKYDMVTFRESFSNKKGVKPLKYRYKD